VPLVMASGAAGEPLGCRDFSLAVEATVSAETPG
jgi:hypothetical protein